MQEGSFQFPSWNVEIQNHNDLFLTWKSITQFLIPAGHVADLFRELNTACQTAHMQLAQTDDFGFISEDVSASQCQSASGPFHNLSLLADTLPQPAADSAKYNRLANADDDEEDGDITTAFPDESEDEDEDIYNYYEVPSDIIDEVPF